MACIAVGGASIAVTVIPAIGPTTADIRVSRAAGGADASTGTGGAGTGDSTFGGGGGGAGQIGGQGGSGDNVSG
jgi:hypothetical protein